MQVSESRRVTAPGYALWHACLDAAAIGLFALGCLALLSTTPVQNLFTFTTAAVICTALLAADLASGIVHFVADNFGNPETPVVGRLFIYPFREHHIDPLAITRHTFLETNGASCLVSLPLLGLALWATDAEKHSLLRLWLICFLLAILATNQIHKWAHSARPPVIVRALQRGRVILPPQAHAIHHSAPHDSYYCITTGWLNYPLTKLRIFPFIAALLQHRRPNR